MYQHKVNIGLSAAVGVIAYILAPDEAIGLAIFTLSWTYWVDFERALRAKRRE